MHSAPLRLRLGVRVGLHAKGVRVKAQHKTMWHGRARGEGTAGPSASVRVCDGGEVGSAQRQAKAVQDPAPPPARLSAHPGRAA
jgi:hypothetical protein